MELAFLSSILNSIGVLWFVVLISFVVVLITTIIYKFTTDQAMMKSLREDIKKLQVNLKKNMSNQNKAMVLQKEMMDKNMKMISHSFKATFITMIPILILFGWLNANLAYMPIQEDVQFAITVNFDDYIGNAEIVVPKGITLIDDATKEIKSSVDWRLSGKLGEYLIEWKVGDKTYSKNVIIANNQKYAEKTEIINDGIVKSIDINYKKQIINIFGLKLSWLWTYILCSVAFSMILKGLLKVY